jgi:hypothetical protein
MTTKTSKKKTPKTPAISSGPVVRVLSYGGGVDSMAMLVLAIRDGDLPDVVIFADVADGAVDRENQDPGEWPGTYRHVREVVIPLCAKLGVRFVWLGTDLYPIRPTKLVPGGARSLLKYFETGHSMPTRASRLCTSAAKVERIADFLAAEFPGRPVEMWIGFEAGEEKRAKKDPHAKRAKGDTRTSRFPLMEAGLCRCRCVELVRDAGFPVPRKSACVFCPFGSPNDFKTLRNDLPEQFDRVAAMEENCKTTGVRVVDGVVEGGKTLRFGYKLGDGTDPSLVEWVTETGRGTKKSGKPYTPRVMGCTVCGAKVRATKATGCDYLEEGSAS